MLASRPTGRQQVGDFAVTSATGNLRGKWSRGIWR